MCQWGSSKEIRSKPVAKEYLTYHVHQFVLTRGGGGHIVVCQSCAVIHSIYTL